jgi:hypothetical protein
MYSSIHISPDAPGKYGDRRGGHRMVVGFTFVEETGVPGENQRSVRSHWQTLSHTAVSSTPCHERDSNSQL